MPDIEYDYAPWYVYMMRLEDDRIYVGSCKDPESRKADHKRGKGSRTSKIFGAGDLIWVEGHQTKQAALRRERQIKRWSHAKKEALISGDLERLKHLSKRRI